MKSDISTYTMSLFSPQIKAFWAIQECQSVHAASRKLLLTQTALTQRLKSLESELNVSLFVRSRRGMQLTPEGEALKRYCQSVMALEGEALAQLSGSNNRKIVNLGITGTTSLLRFRLIPAMIPVLKNYSYLAPQFEFSDQPNWFESLRSGRTQMAILPQHALVAELETKMLRPELFVLMGPKEWAHRSLKDIISHERLVNFNSEEPLLKAYLEKFQLGALVRSDLYIANNNEAIADLVQNGLGYALVSNEMAKKFSERCDITFLNQGLCIEQPTALAWYSRPKLSDYWSAIIKSVK